MLLAHRLAFLTPFVLSINFSRAMSTKSAATKDAALIFLHGLGDTPSGWASLRQDLPSLNPKLSNLKYVFPASPTIPLSINGGMAIPGWFDIYDWPIGPGAKDDKDGLNSSLSKIEAEVQKLEESGISRDRIVVGGFSQGGAVALLTAYQSANISKPFAGCVSLSGWLTNHGNPVVDASKSTPLFWGHGEYDDKVLFELHEIGVKRLKEQGIKVEASSYPMQHSSCSEEMQAFASFLEKVLYSKDN